MKKPAITVLMPVYNAEKFLKESIESVLNQTFIDFEFLIIDDGSSDGSVELIKSYKDYRIRFFQNEKNKGISSTLNWGIDLSRADLIARMDADDICFPERLQKQYDFIQSHPDGALYSCWVRKITEDRQIIEDHLLNPKHYYFNLTFSCWIYHPTMIYRREAIIGIGKYTVPFSEDFELAWQVSREYKIYQQPAVLLEYRNSETSLWQVTKKAEYKEAAVNQVKRNILYYLNDNKTNIHDYQAEILSYFYNPICFKKDDLRKILSSLRLMNIIAAKMLKKHNVNLDEWSLKKAAMEKRKYILYFYYPKLPRFHRIILLMRPVGWQILQNQALQKMKKLLAKLPFNWKLFFG